MNKRAMKSEEFPPKLATLLRRMRHGRIGRKSYSEGYVNTLTQALGQYLQVAQRAELSPAFSPETIGLFIDEIDGRALKNTTRLQYLASLMTVAKLMDYPACHVQMISDDIASYREKAALEPSRKRQMLAQNPLTLADVALLAKNKVLPAYEVGGCPSRYNLFIMSGLLAFLSFIPLRIGDVARLKVGNDIWRNPEGWMIDVSAKKNDFQSFARLHSSLTPYLDRLIHFGDRDRFSKMYDDRIGSTLFINEKLTAYSPPKLSSLFKKATGHSAHIVRTLVHDAMAEAGKGGTDLALILCGQKTRSIAKVYEVYAEGIRIRRGQEAISQIQARLLRDEKEGDTQS